MIGRWNRRFQPASANFAGHFQAISRPFAGHLRARAGAFSNVGCKKARHEGGQIAALIS
jgi:hypothetical protein